MGASFSSFTLPDQPSRSLLRDLIYQHLDADRHDNGRSYSGSIGMKDSIVILDDIFNDEQKASDFLSERFPHKWGPGGAVRLHKPVKMLDPSKAEEELTAALRATGWRSPASIVEQEVLARVKAAKSKTRGCGHCGSAIAVSYIRSVTCPVCGKDFLSSAADQKKAARLVADLEAKRSRLTKMQEDRAVASIKQFGATISWFIGGWCSS